MVRYRKMLGGTMVVWGHFSLPKVLSFTLEYTTGGVL
jgi:hypothetical protein